MEIYESKLMSNRHANRVDNESEDANDVDEQSEEILESSSERSDNRLKNTQNINYFK
jgi:hypothetical protein